MPVLVRQMREHDEEEEDIFDSSVNLEGSHLQQGFEDGFRDGVVVGKDEGREVGLKTGFELGGLSWDRRWGSIKVVLTFGKQLSRKTGMPSLPEHNGTSTSSMSSCLLMCF
jgi:hypothetical protein